MYTMPVDLKRKFTISEVNAMSFDQFIQNFGDVVDNCGFLSASVWRYRPFASLADLQRAFCDYMSNLSPAGKEAILRLMPDVTGKSAQGIELANESIRERASARLNTLTEEEIQTMSRLNQRYTEKFGFHFVLCARENKKPAFLSGLESRYDNPVEIEAVVGVREVKKICCFRIADLVQDQESTTTTHLPACISKTVSSRL